MTIQLNARLDEQAALIQATSIGALTGAAGDAAYVSLKNYRKATVVLDVLNGATVTGGTVTLKQATSVAGANEKALAFTRLVASTDVAASQALGELVAVNNAFTTDATNAKRLRYIIEIDSDQLDADNNFDCFRVDVAGMANATGLVSYILWGGRYTGSSPMGN